jgi:acyl-CoA thioesterase I
VYDIYFGSASGLARIGETSQPGYNMTSLSPGTVLVADRGVRQEVPAAGIYLVLFDSAVVSMKRRVAAATIALAICVAHAQTKVACVGNSITSGSELRNPQTESYPAVLGDLLGSAFEMGNFGDPSTCLLKSSDHPYWNGPEFNQVFSFKPDIITIMLGTNDSKPHNWIRGAFEADMNALIDTFLTISSAPSIFLCLPPPVFPNLKYDIDGAVIHEEIVPLVGAIARERGLSVIDAHTPLFGDTALFPDGVHPNPEGAAKIAEIFRAALLSSSTGLSRVADCGPAMCGLRHASGRRTSRAATVFLPGKGGLTAPGQRSAVFRLDGRTVESHRASAGIAAGAILKK